MQMRKSVKMMLVMTVLSTNAIYLLATVSIWFRLAIFKLPTFLSSKRTDFWYYVECNIVNQSNFKVIQTLNKEQNEKLVEFIRNAAHYSKTPSNLTSPQDASNAGPAFQKIFILESNAIIAFSWCIINRIGFGHKTRAISDFRVD